MSSAQQTEGVRAADTVGSESRGSLAPLLPEGASTSFGTGQSVADGGTPGNGVKAKKRDFWKFGKKNEDESGNNQGKAPISTKTTAPIIAPIAALRPVSPLRSPDSMRASASPQRSYPYAAPGSPGQGLYSSSPRTHSPASSQIFERNVQEDVQPPQASPQIPSHIINENNIPPALDAASAAITDKKLDPDSVEIVTHAQHQPASVTITGAGLDQSVSSSMHDDVGHSQRYDGDNTSTYGSLDNADVRRLSFISFADVVHAEHNEHAEVGDLSTRRDSAALQGPNHLNLAAPRSPSPMRSPVSSHAPGTSPPTSIGTSAKGLETSPNRGHRGPGSPLLGQPSPLGGELNIETMRQALRKTGSGDLSGARSQPMSAISNEDVTYHDRTLR